MTQEVTRADIDRIHTRLDQVAEGQLAQAVALARMEERIAQIKPVIVPPRPCDFHQKHLNDHAQAERDNRATWRDILVRFATPAISAAGGAIAVLFGMQKS